MAQFGRALRSGRRSRRFESCHADLKLQSLKGGWSFKLEGFMIPIKNNTVVMPTVHITSAFRVLKTGQLDISENIM